MEAVTVGAEGLGTRAWTRKRQPRWRAWSHNLGAS
jgi:hypothetical protein